MKGIHWKMVGLMAIICVMTIETGFSQQYDRSAGIRLGGTSGLTYKKFIVEEQAFETIISNRSSGVQVTGLIIFHQPMEFSFDENFYFYYGAGAHVGMEKHGDIHKVPFNGTQDYRYVNKEFVAVGVDAIAGVEYRLLSVPITMSIDLKPYINYVGLRKLKTDFWDVSIGFKYLF